MHIADDPEERRLRQPRSTGWEYIGRQLKGPAVSVGQIMQEAVINGIPDNGGWELMLPWTPLPNGDVILMFKRPLANVEVATSLQEALAKSR